MKTRLLKRVRKRFVIKKITDIGTQPTPLHKHGAKEFGLPFYTIKDDNGSIFAKSACAGDYDSALNILQSMVVDEYHEKFRGRKAKSETVWYKR